MKRYKNIVTVDFETYYDVEYSLRKLTNTAYVRDKRFKVQGVGIKKDTWNKPRWFLPVAAKRALASIDWGNTGLLCHHTHFDGFILSHHYNIIPAYYLDTLSMARPLHGGQIRNNLDTLAKYYGRGNKLPDILSKTKGVRNLPSELAAQLGKYCCVDVKITEAIYYDMVQFYPEKELDLIHHTVAMFCDPVCIIDKKIAAEEHTNEIKKKKKLLTSIAPITATQLRSRKQFPELLADLGVKAPTKTSPTTGKETFAFAKTDQAWLDMQDHEDPAVRKLCKAKAIVSSSIDETRARRLLEHGEPTLPIYLNYGKAHTFRWTGGDKMNPQNFKRDSRLRNAICAPPGHRFVIVDSAQIEARVNAWLSGQTDLLTDFRNGIDVYSEFAANEIYRITVKKITKEQRFVGKVCILALGFNMGWKKFKHTLNIGSMGPPIFLEADAEYGRIVRTYRDRFRAIVNQWQAMENKITFMRTCIADEYETYGPLEFERGRVLLPNQMRLRYPGLHRIQDPEEASRFQTIYNEKYKIYGGLLTENIVQALARIIVADQILEVAWNYKPVMLVHDEVVLCVPTRQAKKALKETLKAFHKPPEWAPNLPVAGERAITTYYQKL